MRVLTAFALFCASCHTGSSNTAAGAVIMTSLALGSSAYSRAHGGCYAVCQQGERCNESTGYCEALPCRGQCNANETCEEGFFGIKCLPGAPLAVQSSTAQSVKPKPPAPPAEKPQDRPRVPDAAAPEAPK